MWLSVLHLLEGKICMCLSYWQTRIGSVERERVNAENDKVNAEVGEGITRTEVRPRITRNNWSGASGSGWVVCWTRVWITDSKKYKHLSCFLELWPSLLLVVHVPVLDHLGRRKPSGFSQFPSPYSSPKGLIGLQIREPHSQDWEQSIRMQWSLGECLWLILKKIWESRLQEGWG